MLTVFKRSLAALTLAAFALPAMMASAAEPLSLQSIESERVQQLVQEQEQAQKRERALKRNEQRINGDGAGQMQRERIEARERMEKRTMTQSGGQSGGASRAGGAAGAGSGRTMMNMGQGRGQKGR
ncbi:MAG: hypothetical protein KDJ27_16900 [Gammaproteobacteria bacterium]|nr:hypothetical protein [Gammaproteobacteria bacterium]